MKPHRLSDLLTDLYRRINPAFGPGRQKGEFAEALANAGIRPEHGNRAEELETLVLVDAKELEELRALRRQVEELREIELSEECRGLLMANGSDGTILVCGEFTNGREFSQKFRARAPSPDVVAVLQRFVDWCEKYPSSRIYDHCEITTIARIMDEIHADAKRALRSGEAWKGAPHA